jgi:hypothetical protein
MEMNSSLLKSKYDGLFRQSSDLLSGMFALGYILERRDEQGNRFVDGEWYNPIHDIFKKAWDEEVWLKARRGSAFTSPTDEELEDPEPREGLVFAKKQVNMAFELVHPDWAIFYILGEAYARYNSAEMTSVEFEHVLALLPASFVKIHGAKLSFLCNHFDEKGMSLHLKVLNNEVQGALIRKEA